MTKKLIYKKILESPRILEIKSVLKKYADRKLQFYDAGLVIYPVNFVGQIAINDAIIETWESINKYGFDKPGGIYRNANKGLFERPNYKDLEFCLYIETKGIIPRCVNRWGMSVFGLMGFLLNEKQVEEIQKIFEANGVEKLPSKDVL